MFMHLVRLVGAAVLGVGILGFFLAAVQRRTAWLVVGIGATAIANWLLGAG
ncbi:hypothetical protein QF002_000993 [Paraburkholderia youngii]